MVNDNKEEEVRVMPKSDFGHTDKTKESTKPASQQATSRPSAAMPPASDRAGEPMSTKPKRSWMRAVIIIFVIALIAASGYFLYSAYKPAEPQSPLVPTEPDEIEDEEPKALPPTTPEEVATPEATVATSEAVPEVATEDVFPDIVTGSKDTFKYGDISELSLDMISSQDSDEDGLTDIEERLFDTEQQNNDTDDDSYFDGAEVVNLYDPRAGEGASLQESALVKTFVNENYKYTIMYPESWFAKGTDKSNLEVVFTSENNEFVSVWIEENPSNLSLKDWYNKQAPNVEPQDLTEFINKNGIVGLKSPDGFTIYFSKDEFVYIIHYNIGLKDKADYPSVYQMMIESFNYVVNQRG